MTVQTTALEPRSAAAARFTCVGFTHTDLNPQVAASTQRRSTWS